MSSRSFTEKEQDLLRQNKYTYSVSANTISFTIEFKKEFWKRYQAGERPKAIIEALGYDPQLLGEARISGLQGMIRKQAMEDNFREGQYQGAMSNYPDYSSMTDRQKLRAMEHEMNIVIRLSLFLVMIIRKRAVSSHLQGFRHSSFFPWNAGRTAGYGRARLTGLQTASVVIRF